MDTFSPTREGLFVRALRRHGLVYRARIEARLGLDEINAEVRFSPLAYRTSAEAQADGCRLADAWIPRLSTRYSSLEVSVIHF